MTKANRYIRPKKNRQKEALTRGLIIVFYGEGKGKTSAALGVALRAAGHELQTLIYQFIKGSWLSGERVAIKKYLSKVKIEATGLGFVGILDDKLPKSQHIRAAKKALKKIGKEIKGGNWELVILDEILCAIKSGLIKEREVIELLKCKPPNLHLILTGQGAFKSLIELADLVTEMKEIKHPFRKGVVAQKGIDY